MTLRRICQCTTSTRTRYCPPDCSTGWIEPYPRTADGRPVPDEQFTVDELAVLTKVRTRLQDAIAGAYRP